LNLNLPEWFGPTVLVGLSVGAVAKGRTEHRLAIGGLVANVVLTQVLRDNSRPHVEWAAFVFDILFLALLLAIALKSASYWPLPAAAFQFLATITHVAKLVDETVHPWAYISAIVIWTYALMISLAAGIWSNWRLERQRAATDGSAADTRR
jgi:hypothetical protein